jgi:hypothetical protein
MERKDHKDAQNTPEGAQESSPLNRAVLSDAVGEVLHTRVKRRDKPPHVRALPRGCVWSVSALAFAVGKNNRGIGCVLDCAPRTRERSGACAS